MAKKKKSCTQLEYGSIALALYRAKPDVSSCSDLHALSTWEVVVDSLIRTLGEEDPFFDGEEFRSMCLEGMRE